MVKSDERIVIVKGNDEIMSGKDGDSSISFADGTLKAGDIVPSGKYQVLLRNHDGDSDKVDVPKFIVKQTSRTLPLLKLEGDVTGMTKADKKVLHVSFSDPHGIEFSGYTKTGWQGNSSVAYPKKNLGLKLYTDKALTNKLNVLPKNTWFPTNKFVLKANYIDATQSRNLVSARLWKQIMTDSTSLTHYQDDAVYKRLASNNQFGSVDGFPIELEINGETQGLYTFNLDNSSDLFGLTSTDTKALLMYAKGWGNVTQFWDATSKLDGSDGDFKAEFPDTVTADNKTSVFNLIANTSIYGIDTFKSYWGNAYNIYNLIDYVLFMNFMNANDNVVNNIGYITYDGSCFWLTPYDLDGTFDLSSGGTWLNKPHNAWQKGTTEMINAFTAYPDIAVARWKELKTNVLNKTNIMNQFNKFKAEVGDYGYNLDKNIWPEDADKRPSWTISTYSQISTAIDDAIAFMDKCANDNFKIVTTQQDTTTK